MKKINIYAINVSPCKPDSFISKQKAEIINEVFNNFNKSKNNIYEMGEIKAFCYNSKNDEGYTVFIEEFVIKKAKEPFILIFNSLLDLSSESPKVAFTRLLTLIRYTNAKVIYFSDYSLKNNARTYLRELSNIFDIGIYKYPEKFKRTGYPSGLSSMAKRLRESPPIRYEDIEKITGITSNTLRSDLKGSGAQGRRLQPAEEEILKKEAEQIVDAFLGSVYEFKNI